MEERLYQCHRSFVTRKILREWQNASPVFPHNKRAWYSPKDRCHQAFYVQRMVLISFPSSSNPYFALAEPDFKTKLPRPL